MQLQKEMKSNPAVRKASPPFKKAIVKIEGGSQEMAVMVG